MLQEAGISKGAAYYYFADKADLIATVVRHYWLSSLIARETAIAELTPDGFWRAVAGLYVHPLVDVDERPWLLGFGRAVWELPKEMLHEGPLKSVAEEANDWMAALLRRGRELGLVRADVPETLLVELVWTMDGVHDRWLGAHWQEMDQPERQRITELFVSFLKRILEPPASGEGAQ